MTDDTHYLYQALEQPVGICLRTNDPDGAIARLAKCKAEGQDPDLQALRIIKSRHFPGHEIWILRKRAQLPAKQEAASHGPTT